MNLLSQSGLSILEVLIGFVLIGIMSLGVSSLLTSQSKEMNSIGQQFIVRELNANLYQSFSDSSYCNCLLNGATLKTDGVAPAPKYSLNLVGHGKLPQMFSPFPTCGELGGLFFPAAGDWLPGKTGIKAANPNYKLTSVQVVNPAPGAEDEFYADLELLLDRDTLVRELRPPKKTINFKINPIGGTADSRPILNCTGVGTMAGGGGGNAMIAVHSQTTTTPNCPAGFDSLWPGFSFGGASGDSGYNAGSPDLGSIGSCVEDFRPMLFAECDAPDRCDYFSPQDYTLWLSAVSTDAGVLYGVANNEPQISRCRACRSSGFSKVIARHSLDTSIPSCPAGGTSLWTGYSISGGTIGGGHAAIRADLSSAGSCLKEFYPIPFLECGGAVGGDADKCDYYTGGDFGYYLSSNTSNTDGVPVTGINTIKTTMISRCVVCAF